MAMENLHCRVLNHSSRDFRFCREVLIRSDWLVSVL